MSRDRRIQISAIAALLVLVACAGPLRAQVYYMYPGAAPMTSSQAAIGGTVGYSSNVSGSDDMLRMVGFGRFNLARTADLGLEFVAEDLGDEWRFGGGGDVRYAIRPEQRPLPFDLSAQVGFGFQSGGGLTNFDIPFAGLISHPLELENGKLITPYAGLFFIIRHYSYDGFGDDTNFDVELRAGTSLELFESGDLFLTIHIGDDVAFFAGFNADI